MQFEYFIIHIIMLNHILCHSHKGVHDAYPFVNSKISYPLNNTQIWPTPKYENRENKFYHLSPDLYIDIDPKDVVFGLLIKMTRRFKEQLSKLKPYTRGHMLVNSYESHKSSHYLGEIQVLHIKIESCCEYYPHSKMLEDYKLTISSHISIEAPRIWGVARALETLFQLCYINEEYVAIDKNTIDDSPRYPHRGLMLDTESRFVSIEGIKKMLDAMAMNKMNVLHWRIVGDTSFPYESNVLPELSQKGALKWDKVYNETTIKEIIVFAAVRGIRVIPEINVPGHIWSIRKSHPEIVTKCYENGEPKGPLNPAVEATFKILEALLSEVCQRFRDDQIHLGGEEFDESCWDANSDVQKYLSDHIYKEFPITLYLLFMKILFEYDVLKSEKTLIVAQDALNHEMANRVFPQETIGQAYNEQVYKKMVHFNRRQVIISWQWDLSECEQRSITLPSMYAKADEMKNPQNHIIGGEVIVLTNFLESKNFFDRVWPRACAAADVMWHGLDDTNNFRDYAAMNKIHQKIQEQSERMMLLGVPITGAYFGEKKDRDKNKKRF